MAQSIRIVQDFPVLCCEKDRLQGRKDASVAFQRKMELAGVRSRDRIAIAVSGGVDSMALCLLAVEWKQKGIVNASDDSAALGLIGLTVDHGLRPESADEVVQVEKWLKHLGMQCEILQCSWPEGVPPPGHVQESARNTRYELLQAACQRNGAEILLTAHHADDQAEVFVLRLSRSSGANGLAGMALATELFPAVPSAESRKLVLVRPLLDISKRDLYEVCKSCGQQWIEDPTNTKMIYARNRIRMGLSSLSDSMRTEIQNLIAVYRKRRAELDLEKTRLLSAFAQVDMCYGYVLVDVEGLLEASKDVSIHEAVMAAILRFVAQRPKPPKGAAVRKAVAWLHRRSVAGRLTVAGCSLCLKAGCKGSKVLVTYSPDSPRPSIRKSRQRKQLSSIEAPSNTIDLELGKCDGCATVLSDAADSKVISEETAVFLNTLTHKMASDMLSKNQTGLEEETANENEEEDSILRPTISMYYSQRYLIQWWQHHPKTCLKCSGGTSCPGGAGFARVRYLKKNDLSEIRKCALDNTLEEDQLKQVQEAWAKLKSLPEFVRRGLPVLTTESDELLGIPSVGFQICVDTRMRIKFCPKVPLDGGQALWS